MSIHTQPRALAGLEGMYPGKPRQCACAEPHNPGWQEIASAEGMDPDQTKLIAAAQEVNSTRAEQQ